MRVGALVGLSGVGKSRLLSSLRKHSHFLHLQASDLLKRELGGKRSVSSEDLRLGDIVANQTLIVQAFQRETRGFTGTVIFDGHSLIEGRRGLVVIPTEVFGSLGTKFVVFLQDKPAAIVLRRQNDLVQQRPSRSVRTIARHQSRAITATADIALELGISLTVITPGQTAVLRWLIEAAC